MVGPVILPISVDEWNGDVEVISSPVQHIASFSCISLLWEISALKKEIDELVKKLLPLGLASTSRTGIVAMTKGFEIYKQH